MSNKFINLTYLWKHLVITWYTICSYSYYSPLHVSSIKYSSSRGQSCTQAAYGTVTLYKSPSVLLICSYRENSVHHVGNYCVVYTGNVWLSIHKEFWTPQSKENNRNRNTGIKWSVGVPNRITCNLIFCLHEGGLQNNISIYYSPVQLTTIIVKFLYNKLSLKYTKFVCRSYRPTTAFIWKYEARF